MANHSQQFNLQLFADSQPAEIADILAGIDENPVIYGNFDNEPAGEDVGEQGEIKANVAEEFDEIVYNKETVKIPVSERQTYLQKGYNYDKIHGKLQEKEAFEGAVNEWVKKTYGEHGINTWQEWQTALAEQERKSQIEDMGLDEDTYKDLIENDPTLKKLRDEAEAFRKSAAEEAINQRMNEEIKALNETYNLKLEKMNDILTLPNAERVIEIARTTGLPLVDSYLIANKDDVLQQKAKAAEQRVRTQAASKSHIKDAARASDSIDLITIPDDVYRMYKDLMPNVPKSEILAHYAKSIKN